MDRLSHLIQNEAARYATWLERVHGHLIEGAVAIIDKGDRVSPDYSLTVHEVGEKARIARLLAGEHGQ